jgi:iron(III) transport system substrate-binding protein
MSDSMVRGEISLGPVQYTAVFPKQRDGAPLEMIFPPEGVPITPYASGIPKTATHPNAARLYLNWCLSVEGQGFMNKQQGNLSSLKKQPVYPKGFDPDKVKVWVPNFEQFVTLHKDWVEEWNKTYNYRQ